MTEIRDEHPSDRTRDRAVFAARAASTEIRLNGLAGPARLLSFPDTLHAPTKGSVVRLVQNALIVAAIIGAVMLVNNMTGQKISTALAA